MRFVTKNIVQWVDDVLHLIYPQTCLVCTRESTHPCICSLCTLDLHYTHFEAYSEPSPLDKLFWGRLPIASTCALLYFKKDKSTQDLLHAIKYKGKGSLAEYLGAQLGKRLLTQERYTNIEAFIPVPLHSKKQYLRGFNQSECIANGLSSVMNIPTDTAVLQRISHTESQTRKNRFARWENVKEVFVANNCSYKHVALVDDVITTGATLEACARALREAHPKLEISILTLALAQ